MGDIDIAKTITDFAEARKGHRVGRGECFDLADVALKRAGAKTASDFGTITADADYAWGKEVPLLTAEPGDILQFRNHEVTVETVTRVKKTKRDGSGRAETEVITRTYTRGHHTAIVKANLGGGLLSIYEQHVKPLGRVVQEHTLQIANTSESKPMRSSTEHTKAGPITVEVNEDVAVTVSGSIKAYRPQK